MCGWMDGQQIETNRQTDRQVCMCAPGVISVHICMYAQVIHSFLLRINKNIEPHSSPRAELSANSIQSLHTPKCEPSLHLKPLSSAPILVVDQGSCMRAEVRIPFLKQMWLGLRTGSGMLWFTSPNLGPTELAEMDKLGRIWGVVFRLTHWHKAGMADEGLCLLPEQRTALPAIQAGFRGRRRSACEVASNLTQASSY